MSVRASLERESSEFINLDELLKKLSVSGEGCTLIEAAKLLYQHTCRNQADYVPKFMRYFGSGAPGAVTSISELVELDLQLGNYIHRGRFSELTDDGKMTFSSHQYGFKSLEISAYFASHGIELDLGLSTVDLLSRIYPVMRGIDLYESCRAQDREHSRGLSLRVDQLNETLSKVGQESLGLKKHIERLEAEALDIKNEAAKRVIPRSDLETNKSLLKLVIGMAIDGYGYDPDASKSAFPNEIANILAKLEMSITDDTVRKYLKEAKETVLPVKARNL